MILENEEALGALLLHIFEGSATPRPLRLFTCARLRQNPQLTRARQPLRAIQLGELLADGLADPKEVRYCQGLWPDGWLSLVADQTAAAPAVLEEHPWSEISGGLALVEELFPSKGGPTSIPDGGRPRWRCWPGQPTPPRGPSPAPWTLPGCSCCPTP